MVELDDDVYGEVSVSEDLLSDLLSSAAVGRLRGVSQAGASSLVREGRTVTRHEHSIGVMILTRLLGGSAKEQAAGLLQDVSHTAFSHTVDYVFDDRKEAFHERIFASVVEDSDVPSILEKYDTSWEELYRPANLKRVDAPAPLLCADRIDYTLRDLLRLTYLTVGDVRDFVQSLCFIDGMIVVASLDQALRFADWYRHLVGEVFMNPLELFAHDELARIIRQGIEERVLSEADLRETDAVVVDRLKKAPHLLSDLESLERVRAVRVGPYPGARRVYSKARVIDPPVLVAGEIKRLSEVRPETAASWAKVLNCGADGLLVSRTG